MDCNEIDLSVEQVPQNPIVLDDSNGDYNSLVNKPKLNGVTLIGNKTSADLGLISEEQVENSISVHNTSGTSHADIRNALSNHTGNTNNPHSVTATQVGLGNCDNTSDLNKPISTATQTALDGKQATLVSGTNIKTINNISLLGSGNIDLSSIGANVDLSNLSATGENHFVQLQSGVAQADVDYVVESYQNGTSWYRVYKSGWCEQGGVVVNITPNQWTFVALLKEYADTNYTVVGSGVDPSVSTSNPDQFFAYRSPLQTTGFYGGFRYMTGSSAFTDRGFSWCACGYLATES